MAAGPSRSHDGKGLVHCNLLCDCPKQLLTSVETRSCGLSMKREAAHSLQMFHRATKIYQTRSGGQAWPWLLKSRSAKGSDSDGLQLLYGSEFVNFDRMWYSRSFGDHPRTQLTPAQSLPSEEDGNVETGLSLATMAMPAKVPVALVYQRLPWLSGVAHHSSAQRKVATAPLNGLEDLRLTSTFTPEE